MEKKPKKKILKKIMIAFLIFIIILIMLFFINRLIMKINDNKIKNAMNTLYKDKITYVFVEINPSTVLIVKNNKVLNISCLNDDCLSLYDDINVKDIDINDSINKIYNTAKSKGFNTDNGVKIKTTGNIEIDKKEYISIEYIDKNKANKLLKDVINSKELKDSNNNDYYIKLWDELKKDKDYNDVYNCKMDNDELKCYIIYKPDISISVDDEDMGLVRLDRFRKLSTYMSKMNRVLNKFGVKTKSDTDMGIFFELSYLYINDLEFDYDIYNWVFRNYDALDNEKSFNITDLNLLNPNEILNRLKTRNIKEEWCLEQIEISNGIKKGQIDCNNNSKLDELNLFICDEDGQNCRNVSKQEYLSAN